jgi:hypothetical protein
VTLARPIGVGILDNGGILPSRPRDYHVALPAALAGSRCARNAIPPKPVGTTRSLRQRCRRSVHFQSNDCRTPQSAALR